MVSTKSYRRKKHRDNETYDQIKKIMSISIFHTKSAVAKQIIYHFKLKCKFCEKKILQK